ncbi:MAG: glycosyltransferase [Desulfobacterales bacterium]|jgi:glycosyltransferase involved in cell wall biosynthesis|nr:glycosyltransferase [Desulfobacterales bacterium]
MKQQKALSALHHKGNMTVSVIIPTYNRAWAIKAAIDSVLSQDYDGHELIVVDDGSTDETNSTLAEYVPRITVIRQANRGVSAARNRGILEATGELIAFLDSDDRWLPGKLSRQVDFFNAHPKALICQTEEIWIRNGVRVNPKNRHQKPSGDIFEPSLQLCLVSPSAVMMQRRLFDSVGAFDEALPACEDYDLWLRVACRYPVYLIDEALIVKTGGHSDQLSKMPALDQFRIASLSRLIESGVLSALQRTAAVTVLREKCQIYAQGCKKRGRSEEAARMKMLAERYA